MRSLLASSHVNLLSKSVKIDLGQQYSKPSISIDGIEINSSNVDRIEISIVMYESGLTLNESKRKQLIKDLESKYECANDQNPRG